jgi:enoyl-CoA hydratase
MSKDLLAAAKKAIKLASKQEIYALLLTARVDRPSSRPVWVAGGNLKELSKIRSKMAAVQYSATMIEFCKVLENLPIPVISIIDGRAIGGGAEIALAADLRIGTRDCSFEWKQLMMGLPTGYGTTPRLVSLIGLAAAQKLLYFSETIEAQQCLSLGLIQELVDSRDDAFKLIDTIMSRLEPKAFKSQKELFCKAAKKFELSTSLQSRIFGSAWLNPLHRKQIEAFLKK